MMYLLLIVGFVLLIKGADLFVDGAAAIAKLLRVPGVIIGLTIVAMGTSAPEASVSITAGLAGSNAIAVSNVVGSNLFNMLVVAGMCAVIKPFNVDKDILKRDFPVNIIASVIVLLCALSGYLTRLNGIILLICMAAYIIFTVVSALKNRIEADDDDEETFFNKIAAKMGNSTGAKSILSIVFCIIGIIAIIFGGDMVVDNASKIASAFGLSDTLIGLTIIAIGTSLPELVTSIAASRKGESGMAMGNVVGSNIFNLFFILGLSSAINPIPLTSVADLSVLLVVTVLIFALCLTGKKRFNRIEGLSCVLIYAAYMIYIIIRN